MTYSSMSEIGMFQQLAQSLASLQTRRKIQHLIFGILDEEFSVSPKPFGYGDNAEYGSDRVRFFGTRNLGGANFSQFPNCPKIILFQPLRYFGICALPTSKFDDGDNRVGVPGI